MYTSSFVKTISTSAKIGTMPICGRRRFDSVKNRYNRMNILDVDMPLPTGGLRILLYGTCKELGAQASLRRQRIANQTHATGRWLGLLLFLPSVKLSEHRRHRLLANRPACQSSIGVCGTSKEGTSLLLWLEALTLSSVARKQETKISP